MSSRKKAKLDDDIKSQDEDSEFTYGTQCNITTNDYQLDSRCGIPLVEHFGLARAVTKPVVLTSTSIDAPT
nr:hypothetical protein [Tanacetum cinerariifolium]GFC40328.1 hypothetical protein [Tanacetum cinerariifolium]